ncbi:unnamed protein product [Brassicogethes aeneus]|uniref:BED-type domain-containing protein n=1 Tax=Brassicogethes aeneus TaxID=1431903 RepID=A0A9P0FEJ0_BRAAE|nr:unnamed protein product [Brassicogethes aeneus]
MSANIVYNDYVSVSKVWKHFLRAENGLSAKCKLCKRILKTKDRSPRGLHVHLKSIHKIDTKTKNVVEVSKVQVISPPPLPPPSSNTGSTNQNMELVTASASTSNVSTESPESSAPAPSARKKRQKITDHFLPVEDTSMEKKVSRMVAKDGIPFRVFCTCKDMRDLFNSSRHKLPKSPNTIKLIVMNYGMTLKMKIMRELAQLKENDHRFTLPFDEWTSSMNKRYMNVNVHTFLNGNAVYWNLGLIRVFGSMPAESGVSILKTKLTEFGLILEKDIINITTDGASVMKKLGRLISLSHQLCYAHGVQLGIIDTIYKKQTDVEKPVIESENEENGDEIYFEMDEISTTDSDSEDDVFHCSIPRIEVDLDAEYAGIIEKVRKLVKFLKDHLLKLILCICSKQEFGKDIKLQLDCETRWSSLADMISTFNRIKLCVSKALIDLGLEADPNYSLSAEEHAVLVNLDKAFQPVKLAVEVLCRRDTDLAIAETTLRFMIRKLEELKTPLAEKLAGSLRKRIVERRTNLTACLLYIRDPAKYQANKEEFAKDETFKLPPKNVVRTEIKSLIERLHSQHSLINSQTQTNSDPSWSIASTSADTANDNAEFNDQDNKPLSSLSETRKSISLQEELQETLTAAFKEPRDRKLTTNSLESLIKKEMKLYESGGSKGELLQFADDCLRSVVPTSHQVTKRPSFHLQQKTLRSSPRLKPLDQRLAST